MGKIKALCGTLVTPQTSGTLTQQEAYARQVANSFYEHHADGTHTQHVYPSQQKIKELKNSQV